jgi:hypothetical protein
MYMPHMPYMPHTPIYIMHLRDMHAARHAAHMPHTFLHTPCLKKNGGLMGQRTIRCTEANARAFQDLVKSDAQLLDLVQQLKAQDMFPGLRAMRITITGDDETLAKGLGAWPAENAPGGRK